MEQPLVSIALCTYNGQRYLEQQLDTLLGQTYPNIELVVVDDVSTDDTWRILTDYAARYKNIKLFKNTANLGYVKNFEKAIGLCIGQYIAMADQDDIWEQDKITLMMNQVGEELLIYHDSEFVDDNGKPLGKKMSDRIKMYSGANALPFLLYNCVSGHACMFKKDLMRHIDGFDARFHHDWYLAFVAACFGGVKYVDKPLVKYRQHHTASTDILGIKTHTKTKKLAFINLPWLQYIGSIDTTYKVYVGKIAALYQKRSILRSFALMVVLLQHYRLLFYIKSKNKSRISIFNLIRKVAFSRNENFNVI